MTDEASPRIGLLAGSASRAGGGVFEALVAHCAILREIGFTPVVVSLEDEHSAEDRARFGETEVITVPRSGPAMLGYSAQMAGALLEAKLDLLHLHGIWIYPSAAATRWAQRTGKPYLISPHGMLDPWIVGRGRLKKWIGRLAYEERSWRRANAFHALTGDEAADIRSATGRSECIVIPNGVEPATGSAQRSPVAAYIGRIHPKKNLVGLVEGWKLARPALAPLGARLRIAGWGDEADVADLRNWIADADDIEFLGPVFGEAKAALLGDARFVALPSHSEGLPMAMLEAWAGGTPTLMSRHCHLPEGVAAGAALDCGTGPEQIADSLRKGFGLPESGWSAMSSAAARLVEERFATEVIGRRWLEAYSALLSR